MLLTSRNPGALRVKALALGVLLLGTVAATDARAEDEPAGAPALRQAREAWDRGSLEAAEPLYREAIGKGGLSPSEVLEGYVRLGAARAALGRRDPALAAFRAASILDADFVVPKEAGKRGEGLAARAKRETAKIGSIELSVEAPKEVAPGESLSAVAKMDERHVPAVHRVGLRATDGTTGKELSFHTTPGAEMAFEIGSELSLAGASISLRVDALDRQNNRLVSAEQRVRVLGDPATVAASGASPDARPSGWDADTRGGSFWSSPWPYVLGGAAVLGASAAVYFGTRLPETVSVSQIGVRSY